MISLILLTALADPAPTVRFVPGKDPARAAVVARVPGLPAGLLAAKDGERLLRVVLLSAKGEPAGPPVLGTYTARGDTLTFEPRFRLTPGERYRATLALGGTDTHAEYVVPADPPAEPPKVAAVYPTAEVLPANLLKFYVHFSKPMREGPAVFDHIRLLDDRGEPVEDPWRRTELWNGDGTRLTLWVHPGRIKEGVNLREQLGPVLEPNRRYTLVVGTKLTDSEGHPLAAKFVKAFRTTAAVRTTIDLGEWAVTAPPAGTRLRLRVRPLRPLDHALLGRSLRVTDAAGNPVAGLGYVGPAEKLWSFAPKEPWAAGEYVVVCDDRLEDVAGNTILRPFDLDLTRPPRKDPPLTLRFRVGERLPPVSNP
jgi:hypothetical protein